MTVKRKVCLLFVFQLHLRRKKLWIQKIPRAGESAHSQFEPTKHSAVCAKHFSEKFIIRNDSFTRPNGTVLTVQRTIPKLTDDAFPSIFPNCPSYLTYEPPTKRKKPDDRQKEIESRDEVAFKKWMSSDKISSFADFSLNFHSHTNNAWTSRLHEPSSGSTDSNSFISFYYIVDEQSIVAASRPMLQAAIRVFKDMSIEVFAENGLLLPKSKLTWIFGENSPLKLSHWTQFETLLSFCAGYKIDKLNRQERIDTLISMLCECTLADDSVDDADADAQQKKLVFCIEQLKLLFSQQKRYSCDTLLEAFRIFATSSSTYRQIRSSILTLPSPSYLKKLSSVFNIDSGVDNDVTHSQYLQQKCANLKEEERTVILMIDEIHVANRITYKGGKLEGAAHNTSSTEASTAQVFMVASVLSKNKDVAAIVPAKNMCADELKELILKVLNMLYTLGYFVLCIISDNNRINRNAFSLVCGGALVPSITHPHHPTEKLFFLFDSVHLFKSLRNNWLGQKDSEKTLLFPSFEDESRNQKASFCHLRKVFSEEKSSTVKLAPSLNTKSLYPTTTERQNVSLMLRVFDVKNVAALEHFDNVWKIDTGGTRQFLSFVSKLWNIVNVKHPYKYARLRNPDCKPIESCDDENLKFLSTACLWLKKWESLKQKPREGPLSKETMFALHHTLHTFVDLCHYLLSVKKFKYVLLGKFQTDNLEFRFSLYRQLSGANYHVSVQQVLEGEKKLKLMSMLKLVSASKGSVSFKSMVDSCEEIKDTCPTFTSDYLSFYDSVLDDCSSITVTTEQCKSLIFISGYAVSKVLPSVSCANCRSKLSLEGERLIVEGTDNCFSYLSAIDRGGLTWPSDAVVSAITVMFKIFQSLIGQKETEDVFLKCKHQKKLLHELTNKVLEHTDLLGMCEECGADHDKVRRQCLKPTANIILNNYSKQFGADMKSSANERKLKTFSN